MINFAELKLKMTEFDEVNTSAYTFGVWLSQSGYDSDMANSFIKGARYQHTKDAKIISELLDVIEMHNEAFDYYIKNAEPVFYEYVGEFPAGGYQQQLGEWTHANKVLSETESKLKQLMDGVEG
jgi:hypothetical protein